MRLTEILKIKGDWQEVADDCRATVGKGALGREPSRDFRRRLLLAEHSPIRDLSVKWRWQDIPHWVGVHWVRHKWECFVRTQRTDRTGVSRDKLPQDAPQSFTGEANVQHTIDTWRKRLCGQAARETVRYAEDFKLALGEADREWADVLVPNCVYRGGCPELRSCGLWPELIRETGGRIQTAPIQERYDLYNEFFRSVHPESKRPEEEASADEDRDSTKQAL